jgi:sugar phosphate permease
VSTATTAPVPHTTVRPRHRWVVLALGVAAQAAFSAMFSGLPVTGVTMRADYGFSTGQLGFVIGCLGLGVAASDIVWGLLTDRFGDRRILLTGLISTGSVLVAMAAVATPADGAGVWRLAGFLFAAGALGGSVNGSSGRAVMTWFSDAERGFAMSVRQTAIPVGGAVGVAVLPPVASAYGFRAAYLTLAVFLLLTAAATARWLRAPGEPAPTAEAVASGPSPLRRWDVWRVALAGALLTVPQFAVLSFAGLFLHDAKGAGAAAAAVAVVTAQLGGGALRIWTGRRSDRGGDRRTYIRVIGVIAAVAMAAVAVLTHAPTPVAVLALAAAGVAANAWHGVAYTEVAVLAGADRAGTALGLAGTTIFAAGFLTPLLLPVLHGATSWPVVWAAAGLAALAAVPLTPSARHR